MIAADDTHQRDAMNVVPLGDHLRADEQIDFARVQPRQQPLQIVPAAHRVAIHAADARKGKDLRQPLFALLRAGAKIVEMLAVALRDSEPEPCAGSRSSGIRAAALRADL